MKDKNESRRGNRGGNRGGIRGGSGGGSRGVNRRVGRNRDGSKKRVEEGEIEEKKRDVIKKKKSNRA